MANIFQRAKEQKRLVEADDLEGAKAKAQKEEGGYANQESYPSQKEVERPVRKTEGGRYEGIGIDVDAPPRKQYDKKRPYQR